MERNRRIWRQCTQLSGRVIDKPVYVLRIKPARNDVECAFGFRILRTRRRGFRHLKMTNDE